MSHQPPENRAKNVWQNLETKGGKMSAAEVRSKAEKLGAEIRRDTIFSFVFASALTLVGLVGLAILPQLEPAARIIIGISVSFTWYGAYRTSVRRKELTLPAEPALATCIEFYRTELQRRRDYFLKLPWFMVFVILLALFLFVVAISRFNPSARDLFLFPGVLVLLLILALFFWKREGRRFQHELNALDTFEKRVE